jgi:hypothetical protein
MNWSMGVQELVWAGMVLKFADGSVISLQTGEAALATFQVQTEYDEREPFFGPDGQAKLVKYPVAANFKLRATRATGHGFPIIHYKLALPDWYQEPSDSTTAKSPDAPAETL